MKPMGRVVLLGFSWYTTNQSQQFQTFLSLTLSMSTRCPVNPPIPLCITSNPLWILPLGLCHANVTCALCHFHIGPHVNWKWPTLVLGNPKFPCQVSTSHWATSHYTSSTTYASTSSFCSNHIMPHVYC